MNRRELIRNAMMTAGALGAGTASAQEEEGGGGKRRGPAPEVKAEQNRTRGIPGSPKRESKEPAPNILWICTDQQRFDTLQGLSNSLIRTPNLVKFMSESVTFTNAFCQTPICSPSRGSFLTGRYPHNTGLRTNGEYIHANELLVPRILADNGYMCGLAGKLHLSPCAQGRLETEERINDGYKMFQWSHDLSDGWPGHNEWRNWLTKNNVKLPPSPGNQSVWGMPISPKFTQTAWCSEVAIKFMADNKGKGPWHMAVNIFQPHHPFHPTEEYLAKYDPKKMPMPKYKPGELDNKTPFQKLDHQGAYGGGGMSYDKLGPEGRQQVTAAYYAMIEQVDVEVGRMMQVLEETGQKDNTVVIFMSDHGEMLGDHGIYWKGPYFYDCLSRVPLIIRWPNHYKAGVKIDSLVELADIAPTLLDAAGILRAAGMQGKSLTPVLTGKTTHHRDDVYMEFLNRGKTYEVNPLIKSLRTTKWKVNYCATRKYGELYDLANDPDEYNNVWDNPHHKDAREMMVEALFTRVMDATDPLPQHVAAW